MNTQEASTIILSVCLGIAVVGVSALPASYVSANDGTKHMAPHKKSQSRKQPSNETGNTESDRDNAMGTTSTTVPAGDVTGQANTASPTTTREK